MPDLSQSLLRSLLRAGASSCGCSTLIVTKETVPSCLFQYQMDYFSNFIAF